MLAPDDADEVVAHFVNAVTAHGLVELDRATVGRSRSWLLQVLPTEDHDKLDAAMRDPAAGPVRDVLADAIHLMLKNNPGLLGEMRSLVGVKPQSVAETDQPSSGP